MEILGSLKEWRAADWLNYASSVFNLLERVRQLTNKNTKTPFIQQLIGLENTEFNYLLPNQAVKHIHFN